jgi:hypothetical protein
MGSEGLANFCPGRPRTIFRVPARTAVRQVFPHYQTRQEFTGNMGWPFVQPKALPKASKF